MFATIGANRERAKDIRNQNEVKVLYIFCHFSTIKIKPYFNQIYNFPLNFEMDCNYFFCSEAL